MHVVALSGSLQRASTNSVLVGAIASATDDVGVWDELEDLPHFRPDLPGDAHVDSLRLAVGTADAVLVATPEYAGGMPGALKNALDWLVGSGELYGKPVVIMSAAPAADRGHNARRWTAETVEMQGARVVDSFTVPLTPSDQPGAIARKAETAWERARGALEAANGAAPDPPAV
jgi:chromate reductase